MNVRITLLLMLTMPLSLVGQVQSPWTTDPESQGMGGLLLPVTGYFQPMGNPANLASLKGLGIGSYTYQPFALPELTSTCIRSWLPAGHGGLGLAMAYSGFGGLRYYTLQTGFGHRLWKRIDGGIQLDGQFVRVPEGNIYIGIQLAAGISFPLGRRLHGGVTIRNAVPLATPETYRTQPSMAATVSYRLSEMVLVGAEWNQEAGAPVDLRIGISYQPVSKLILRSGYQSRTSSFFVGAAYSILRNWDLAIAGGFHPFLGFTPSAGFGYSLPKAP